MEWKAGVTVQKDPDAILDYKFDWAALTNSNGSSDWLEAGETIDSYVITVGAGLTKDSDSKQDGDKSVAVVLSGGVHDTEYEVACKITTTGGSVVRTDERTIKIYVYNQ